jgi:hypothetical protein
MIGVTTSSMSARMANANGVHHNLLNIGIEGGDPVRPVRRPISEGSGRRTSRRYLQA